MSIITGIENQPETITDADYKTIDGYTRRIKQVVKSHKAITTTENDLQGERLYSLDLQE